MRDLEIAFGANRGSLNWKNEYLTWSEFVQRLSALRRTSETMSAYDAMSAAAKGKVKDGHAYVGGGVTGGRRKKENVQSRSLLTLDIDHADDDFLFMVELILGGTAHIIYSTHSHRSDKPKYRLVVPTNREMSPDEYAASSRKLAANIGMKYFDKTTFDVHRLMYLPSCSKDAEPVFTEIEGNMLDVDALLAEYENWMDPVQWERHPKEEAQRRTNAKMEDPREKSGIIGAFCRHYSISGAIETFLSEAYEQTAVEDRYTFTGSSSHGGLVIYDQDTFAYSHHESDPISGREVNAFDLVRLHKFKSLDDNAKDKTNIIKLPSYLAMVELVTSLPEMKRLKMQELQDDFSNMLEVGDMEDGDAWVELLDVSKKTGDILPTSKNARLLLSHGAFKGVVAYDEFKNGEVIKDNLPWRKRKQPNKEYEAWLGADDKRMLHYFGEKYEIKAADTIKNAFTEVLHSNAFHPVKDYLESFTWDGVSRLDTLFIDYNGADNTLYVRMVTRKMFVAAVKRIYEPGCKFDNMLVLVGPQGAHKSTILNKMGQGWFSDSLKTFDSKDAGEHLQGAWIIEIGELAAMKTAAVEEIKQFLSKESDRYRVAFDRVVSDFPRKCVFFGTTNNFNFLQDSTGNRRFWPVTVNPEKRTKDHFKDLDGELVGQLWAEALVAYRDGESLELTKEIRDCAERIQSAHLELDPREGIIAEYLDIPITIDWYSRDVYDRRDYYNAPTGGIERTKVCAAEIWHECLGNDYKKMGRWDARLIVGVIRNLPGWRESETRVNLPGYGKQTLFMRTLLQTS